MSVIDVKKAESKRERRKFLTFPWKVYRGDPLWVPPLVPELEKVIDPRKGVFFERGEAEIFLAYRDGELAGTICAAEDPPVNQKRGKADCLFGFFEYLPDFQVFQALIERVESWAASRGLTALYGPWNLDYEDSYGVLVGGDAQPPALMCGHSPPYYARFMEQAGFMPARAENVALMIDLKQSSKMERLSRLAEKIRTRSRFTVRSADFDHWDREVDRVYQLLNRSLAHLDDHIGWRRDSLEAMLAPFKKIADPEMILFADHEEETIGFLPGLPNLNEVLIQGNGLRCPWDYLGTAWRMRSHQFTGMTVKSVLVLPAYWNSGAAVLLFDSLVRRARERGYRWADLSLTSTDNPSSVLTAEKLGARIYKRYQVYRRPITLSG